MWQKLCDVTLKERFSISLVRDHYNDYDQINIHTIMVNFICSKRGFFFRDAHLSCRVSAYDRLFVIFISIIIVMMISV